MLIKSKINLINKHNPTRKTEVFEKGKFRNIEETVYLVKVGEEVGIISKSFYVGKQGCFYCVINSKNETFTLDKNDLEDFEFDLDLNLVTKISSLDFNDFKTKEFNLFD